MIILQTGQNYFAFGLSAKRCDE